MKKIVIIIILLCFITGCKNSGQLTNTCSRKKLSNTLQEEIVYTIDFQKDIVQKISITYDYQDEDIHTISALKLSFDTNNPFLKADYEVLVDESNHYKIRYHLDNNSSDTIKKYFNYQEKRSKLINELKEQEFTCK